MSVELVFGLGALALGVGAVVIAFLGGATNNRQAAKTAIHATVPLVGAIAYILLATGLGVFDVDGDGVGFPYARFIAWSITTPLLLLGLLVTAAPLGRNLWTLALAVVFADVAMILTGMVAAAGEPTTAAAWFLVATACFLVVLALMWGPVRASAEEGHPFRAEAYRRHLSILTVLWAAYPVVFLFGPVGAEIYGTTGDAALFAILDVAAKAGYGVLVVLEDHRLAAAENADRRTLAFPPEPAPVADPDGEEAVPPARAPVLATEDAAGTAPQVPPVPAHAPGGLAGGFAAPPLPWRASAAWSRERARAPAPEWPDAPAPAPRAPEPRRSWATRASDMVPAAVVTSILVMISRPRGRR